MPDNRDVSEIVAVVANIIRNESQYRLNIEEAERMAHYSVAVTLQWAAVTASELGDNTGIINTVRKLNSEANKAAG